MIIRVVTAAAAAAYCCTGTYLLSHKTGQYERMDLETDKLLLRLLMICTLCMEDMYGIRTPSCSDRSLSQVSAWHGSSGCFIFLPDPQAF